MFKIIQFWKRVCSINLCRGKQNYKKQFYVALNTVCLFNSKNIKHICMNHIHKWENISNSLEQRLNAIFKLFYVIKLLLRVKNKAV